MSANPEIAARLKQIEELLSSKAIHCLADPLTRRITVPAPRVGDDECHDTLWERVSCAPYVELTEDDLLGDDYLDVAFRRVVALHWSRPQQPHSE